ncbi:MAG: hypothetical protein ACRD25_00080 [Terracidiphilus sp.]
MVVPVWRSASHLPELVGIAGIGQFRYSRHCSETEDRMGHGKAARWFAASVLLAFIA